MGVYIPNIEMPKSCWNCELLSSCKAMPKKPTADEIGIYTIMRLNDCPLIDIDLVRCGECKWWNEETHGCDRNPSVKAWWRTDFCSYGERRTDE